MAVPPTPTPGTPSPAPGAPTPRGAPGELGARLERQAREQRPPTFHGKGWVVALVFALAGGGLLVQCLQGGTGSPLAQAVRDTYGKRPPEPEPPREMPVGPGIVAAPGPTAPPAAPTPPASPTPAAPPAAPAVPGPGAPGPLDGESSVRVPSALDLARAALRAPPKERPALRRLALHAFAELAAQPAHRRAALEAALRLSPEAMPEEAAEWTRLAEAAIATLATPEAGLGILYLGTVFDRGGEPGLAELERVVDDERRGLDLRVAAARALPAARRAPLAARIASRRDAHPALLAALR